MARRRTTSVTAITSERSDFRNLSRAGVAEKRSRTSTIVPLLTAAARTGAFAPRATSTAKPCSAWRARDLIARCAIEPIDGRASPRNPSERIANRSSSSSFDVACRSTQSARSSALIPEPSSVTRISDSPPPTTTISICVAPASMAFSISSLTTLAGRSTTSPAAMRLIVSGLSWRIATASVSSSRKRC